MLPNVEVRLESTIDNELVNNVFMLTLDTKMVAAESDVVDPLNPAPGIIPLIEDTLKLRVERV